MLKSSFSLEPRADGSRGQIEPGDIVYRRKPEKAHLSLPEASRHRSGTMDLEYDPRALVWLEKRVSVDPTDPRAPRPTNRPIATGSEVWEVWCGSVRMWILRAAGHEAAMAEAYRLAGCGDFSLRRPSGQS